MTPRTLNYDPDTDTMFLQDTRGVFVQELPTPAMVRWLWQQMCEFDGVEPAALFVVFSKDNPFDGVYNKAVQIYQHNRVTA